MTTRSHRNADLHLADVLSKDVENRPPSELLAEVAEDFGDRRTLAMEFDHALARAVARDRKRRIVEFFYGAGNWKPIAIGAALVIAVAAMGTLYLVDRAQREAQWRTAQSEMRAPTSSDHLARTRDAELDAFQARFELLRGAGDLAAAKVSAEQYLLVAQARYGEEHPTYARGLNDLALAYQDVGDYRQAEPIFLRSIAITEKALGPEHPSLVTPLTGLASLYEAQVRLRDARSTDWGNTTGAARGLADATGLRSKLAKVQGRLAKVRDSTGAQSSEPRTAQSGELLWVLRGHTNTVESSAFSPDGKRLVTASSGSLRLWDVATGRLTDELTGRRSSLLSLTFAADGQIVAAYADGTVLTWVRGRPPMIETLPPVPGRRLAVTSDGRQLVATDTNIVKLLDRASEIAAFGGHTGPVTNAAFGPNGTRILTVSDDRTIRVWNAATAQPLSVLRNEAGPLSAAFSPDGTQLVSIGKDDRNAYLWNVATGAQTIVLTGHLEPVLHAAFSRDGKQLVTTSNDGTARLWDARTGRARAILRGHEAAVTSAAFSPDGRLVATTSEDRTARLWRVITRDTVQVQADSVTYGTDGRITFQGRVELYYGLFILTADEVLYDAKGQALTASGSVVVRNPDGSRAEADRYVLPAEIRDAFEQSLSTTAPDGTVPQLRNAPSQQR